MSGFLAGAISPVVVGSVIDVLRAGDYNDTLVWGMAISTLGFGGLMAVLFATRLPDHPRN